MRALWVAVMLVGCGKELHHTTDAGPPDTSSDAPVSSSDVPAGAVQLTVRRGTDALANVLVLFQDPASNVIAQKATNELGLAWALMPDGGFVTALQHGGSGPDELDTFAAVQPGDVLKLVSMDPGQHKQWPVKLSFPPDTGVGPSATSYVVHTSCSGEPYGVQNPQPTASDPPNAMLLSGCDDGLATFVIVSFDSNGDPTGRILYAENVVLPAPPMPPATDAPSDFPLLALSSGFAATSTHSASYTNVPDTIAALGVYQGISADRRAYDATASLPRTGPTVSGPLGSAQFPTTGPSTMLTATTGYPTGSPVSQFVFYDWGPMSATYNLDVSTAYIPVYLTAPAYDAATRTISWTEGQASLAADVVRGRIHVYRDDVPAGRSWTWRVVAPHTGASLTYPHLPVMDFDFTPRPGDQTGVDELTTAKLPGGYDGWRARGFGEFTQAITSGSGTMSVQSLYSAPL